MDGSDSRMTVESRCEQCELVPAAEGRVLFLKAIKLDCKYCLAFGSGWVCTKRHREAVGKELVAWSGV